MTITPAPVLNFQLNSGSGSFNLSLGGENDVSRVKRGQYNEKVRETLAYTVLTHGSEKIVFAPFLTVT